MADETTTPVSLVPRLVVADPDVAAEFYSAGLGADILGRFTMPDGTVTNIDITIGVGEPPARLSLTAEVAQWGLLGPQATGSSPVLLRLTVPDARSTRDRMVRAGAEELIPVDERPYGRCEGRLRDPFGHLWIVSHITEQLTDDEIRDRLATEYANS